MRGLILFLALGVSIHSDSTMLQTNCLIHQSKKLFVLIHLKSPQPYQIHTSQGNTIYFNFCDPFNLPHYNCTGSHLGYLINNQVGQCIPLTSSTSGMMHVLQTYSDFYGQNTLNILYDTGKSHQSRLSLCLVCSQQEFEIINSNVTIKSVHGCPIYQIPSLLQLIEDYELLVIIFCFLVGFLFLFYGRVMIDITTFFSLSIFSIVYLNFLCFKFMQQNVEQIYLYIAILIIIIVSFVASYFITKNFIKGGLFFIGAQFGFFIGTFIKSFILMFLAQNIRLAKIADTIISFVTVAIMFLLGSLTLQHHQNIIIYSTSISGSYLIVRGFSLIFGGFPTEYQLIDQIQSKQLNYIPLSFYIYFLLIVLLATIGGIYQQLKLKKQKGNQTESNSIISERVSLYIEANLDTIHNRIESIIDRYRISNHQIEHQMAQIRLEEQNSYQKMEQIQKK